MVVAVRVSPPMKGRVPSRLNMLELVSVANNRYTVSKLRKRALAPGFCYVCSKIDPGGVFRSPNAHLFRKGFMAACEHQPKAPDPTFVQEERMLAVAIDGHREGLLTERTATHHAKLPSISVTIRHGSHSTSHLSPLKRERTFDSTVSRKQLIASTDSELLRKSSDSRLPSLKTATPGASPTKSSKMFAPTPLSSLSKPSASLRQSQTLPDNSEAATELIGAERVTVIPTGNEDRGSGITGLSSFSKGTTPTVTTTDLDVDEKLTETDLLSVEKLTLRNSLRASDGKQTFVLKSAPQSQYSTELHQIPLVPFINRTDGLDDPLLTQPLVREAAMLDYTRGVPGSRPRAGRQRERLKLRHHNDSSTGSAQTDRPGSGHLRYHHRAEEDSVPDPGFEIPPTPSDMSLSLSLSNESQGEAASRQTEGRSRKQSKTGRSVITNSDDTTIKFSDGDASEARSRISNLPSGKTTSFCRCVSNLREVSFTRNVCKTCGKPYYISDSGSAATKTQYDYDTSRRSVSLRNKMLQQGGGKVTRKSKNFSDEDYMDFDLNEDQYLSSDDDEFPGHFDDSPTSWYRYKHAQPYPLVDPDTHKIVYLKALHAAQIKALQRSEEELDEKLRRPNVFSYIPLLKRMSVDGVTPRAIGIRPDKPVKIKNGQFMKHIFGDIKPEDFYTGNVVPGRLVFDETPRTTETDAEATTTTRSSGKDTQPIMNDPERSSVSLKMSRKGVNFDNKND
ncbi:hypothetical protein MAR_030883 [Mya arenaria]|uniref:Uncharacterized protein n=1 Tax=Mya arenaria TaxID=6604 RepID=A0ABY7F4I1_MYAAR|nr:uncharacterized protein LOC128205275 isoform X2 [Mya arenaria]XP_052762761.1 uncharacterized protein LOC128205275 isoform X2 [Mya arenaria]WAR16289.1 hypothetical protein MAR_030883 [Mya arenaria]